MGNTHDSEITRIEADYIHTKWKKTEDYRWGYSSDRGPETWWVYYPSASGGMQSPIDLITQEVTWDPDLHYHPLNICYNLSSDFGVQSDSNSQENPDDLSETNYSDSFILKNTGNSTTITTHNSKSYITGGPCKTSHFLLDHINIHWGDSDSSGSEHLINTHSSAAEIHFIHWNEELYENFEEASKREEGIVTMAVLVEINNEKSNKGLKYLTSQLQDVLYRGQSVLLKSDFDVSVFLPENMSKYWTYRGSFTTPPCYETVTWIVFHDSISVTSEDIAKFRNLKSYEENETRPNDEFLGKIQKNCRLVQPLGTRRVYTTENIHNKYLAVFDDPFRATNLFSDLPNPSEPVAKKARIRPFHEHRQFTRVQ